MNNGFELHISDNDITNGTIAVSWCVPKEILEALDKAGIKDPAIVLMTAPYDGINHYKLKEYRKVVPLKDLMAYVEFRSSGTNRIWGFIDGKDEYSYFKKRYYLDRFSNGKYVRGIVDPNLAQNFYFEHINYNAEPLTVEVPDSVFAKEPSEWEKKWVNLFHSYDAIDQCQFRKRRLFAYSLQIPVALICWTFAYLLPFIFAFLFGTRGLSAKPMLRPLQYPPLAALLVLKGGSYFYNPNETGWRKYIKLPFMPIMLIAEFLCVYALLHLGAAWATSLLRVLGMLAGIAICIIFTIIKIVVHNERKQKDPAWFMNGEHQKLLVCSDGKIKPKSVADLPKENQSIRLKFSEIKSKICKPFST